MTKKLLIYLNEIFAGILEQDLSGRLAFSYDEKYLASADAIPLSISLPLGNENFSHNISSAFFSGILPDDYQRKILAKNLGVSERNPFAILFEIGGDCAGAIAAYPSSKQLILDDTKPDHILTENELEKIIKELPSHPMLAGIKKIRLSLAGAQSKLPVFFDEKKNSLPRLTEGGPSTHILKPSLPDLPDSSYNEFFCMKLAKEFGLDTAEVFLQFAKKNPYLLIRRYDRILDSRGRITRIHQEDFCQAMAIPPDLKYQIQGGPSIKSSLQLIEKHSTHAALDKMKFIRTAIFNYLIGNSDAHGKNFSFLHLKNGAKLAPLYDLVCTAAYPKLDRKLAMKIGIYEWERVSIKHWYDIVEDTNTAISYMKKELKFFATKLPQTAKTLQIKLEEQGIKAEIFNTICGVITKRSERILKFF